MTLLEKKVSGRNSFKSDGKIEIRTSQPASKEYILLQHIISKIIFCFSFFHSLPQRDLSDNHELFLYESTSASSSTHSLLGLLKYDKKIRSNLSRKLSSFVAVDYRLVYHTTPTAIA